MVPVLSSLLPPGVLGPRSGGTVTLRRFELDGAAYGGLIGTVTDAARLLAVFTNGGTVGSTSVLRRESVEAMTAITTKGRPYDVGLGWLRPHGDPPDSVEHFGGGIGYFNVLRVNLAAGCGAVVMSNTTKHWDIAGFADSADRRRPVDDAARAEPAARHPAMTDGHGGDGVDTIDPANRPKPVESWARRLPGGFHPNLTTAVHDTHHARHLATRSAIALAALTVLGTWRRYSSDLKVHRARVTAAARSSPRGSARSNTPSPAPARRSLSHTAPAAGSIRRSPHRRASPWVGFG